MSISNRHSKNAAQLLMFVSGYVYRLLRYEARHAKIRWTALMVLKDLDLLGPSNQRTLAEIEQVRAPTMTVLVQQMERHGWVRRKADAKDARSSLVRITPKGRKQLRSSGLRLRQSLEAELVDVPPDVLKTLGEGLSSLSSTLIDKISGGARGRPARAP